MLALDGLVFVTVVALVYLEIWQQLLAGMSEFFGIAVLVVGLLVSWRFRRSRLFFALVLLALSERALMFSAPLGRTYQEFLFHALTIVIPANLLWLSLMEERGVLSRAGAFRIGIFLTQGAVGLVGLTKFPEATLRVLDFDFLPQSLHQWTEISSLGLSVFFVSVATVGFRLAKQPNATGRGFFWAVFAVFLAFHRGFGNEWLSIFLPTAGLLLVISAVEAIYYMAFRDALTGLPTRRGLGDAMLRLTGRYTVAMVDVDHFKKFNDQHGHEIGDQVLKMVASTMERVSGGGEAFRYGGEEFTILFPGLRAIDAKVHLEKLREKISHTPFVMRGPNRPKLKPETPIESDPRGKSLSVTVSIGAAERVDRRAAPSEILQRADQALYRAKQAGRNQVRLFDR